MAKCKISVPEEFLLRLSKLGDRTDTIIPKVLKAGGEVVLAKVKSNLSAVVGHGTKYESRSTGQLERSLGLSPAKQNRDGNWDVKVGFSENRTDNPSRAGSKSNAMLANVLEYGKSGQPPKPFLKPAKSASKSAVVEAMKQKFEQETENI